MENKLLELDVEDGGFGGIKDRYLDLLYPLERNIIDLYYNGPLPDRLIRGGYVQLDWASEQPVQTNGFQTMVFNNFSNFTFLIWLDIPSPFTKGKWCETRCVMLACSSNATRIPTIFRPPSESR